MSPKNLDNENYDVDALCQHLSESDSVRFFIIQDHIQSLNRYFSKNHEEVSRIEQELLQVNGSQGYFDGSLKNIDRVKKCLSDKNVETSLNNELIKFDKLFSVIGKHVSDNVTGMKLNESIVFSLENGARKNGERVLAGADVRAAGDPIIYIKPNALFGLGVTLFIFMAVLIWYCCMSTLEGSYEFKKDLKFSRGKEY